MFFSSHFLFSVFADERGEDARGQEESVSPVALGNGTQLGRREEQIQGHRR